LRGGQSEGKKKSDIVRGIDRLSKKKKSYFSSSSPLLLFSFSFLFFLLLSDLICVNMIFEALGLLRWHPSGPLGSSMCNTLRSSGSYQGFALRGSALELSVTTGTAARSKLSYLDPTLTVHLYVTVGQAIHSYGKTRGTTGGKPRDSIPAVTLPLLYSKFVCRTQPSIQLIIVMAGTRKRHRYVITVLYL
jgi:hypothetical protein